MRWASNWCFFVGLRVKGLGPRVYRAYRVYSLGFNLVFRVLRYFFPKGWGRRSCSKDAKRDLAQRKPVMEQGHCWPYVVQR